jgi:hypothetical protein
MIFSHRPKDGRFVDKSHLMGILALDRNAKINIPNDARTVILTEELRGNPIF